MPAARRKVRKTTPLNSTARIFNAQTHSKRRSKSSTQVRFKIIICAVLVLATGIWIFNPLKRMAEAYKVLSESTHITPSPVPTPPTRINENFYNQVVACLIPIATYYGYTLDVSSGYRTYEEEDAIYAQGRTAPGEIVSYVKGGRSTHNYGLAVDLVDDVNSYDIDWQRLGKIGSYCGLEHGDNGHEDLPHFQYQGGLTKDQLQTGIAPPPLEIPCPLLQQRFDAGQPLSAADVKSCKIPKL